MRNKYILSLLYLTILFGEEDSRFTVAVIDFEPRGITAQEAGTLTDRFSSELNNTNTMRLVERGLVDEILQEQGFQQSGCTTDECTVEVGALLGVQKMVNGSIGKIGDTYTIDIKLVSVQSGATEKTKSISYMGKVDGLITEMELLAWTMMEMTPPQALVEKKRMGIQAFSAQPVKQKTKHGAMLRSLVIPGFGQLYSDRKLSGFSFMGLELALIGLAVNSQSSFNSLQGDQDDVRALYSASTSQDDIETYVAQLIQIENDLEAANDQIMLFSASAAGLWAVNVIHAFISGPKDSFSSLPVSLAYDPVMKQTRLKWTVSF